MENSLLSKILDYSIKYSASDIHITQWKPITYRIDWNLIIKKEAWVIDFNSIKIFLDELLNNNQVNIKKFNEWHDLDFAYIYKDSMSFRVNAFYKLWKISFVLRRIWSDVISLEELWLPESINKITSLKQWLVLVTWPTWSWKSTTMISILDHINKNRTEHILTIEDPVEFIFKDNKSIFSQREVWVDTESFHSALRAAMREDPNIIMVWEMRDEVTVSAALELAETWHLVISTLHTSGSVQTITRLLSFFPSWYQNVIRDKLSNNLECVLSQRLIPKANGGWRIWIFEVMLMTLWVKNSIRNWNLSQINSIIEVWKKEWMVSMKKYAQYLEAKGIIKKEDYKNYFVEEN